MNISVELVSSNTRYYTYGNEEHSVSAASGFAAWYVHSSQRSPKKVAEIQPVIVQKR